jgi:hypothetical protein
VNIWGNKTALGKRKKLQFVAHGEHGITVEKHSYNSATFEAVRKGKVYKIRVQAMGIFGFSFLGIEFCEMIHGNI